MNQIFYLVVASLFVGGMVAVTIPDTVYAEKPNVRWCVEGGAATGCADTKAECKALWASFGGKCVKQ
jgi:hypothetical protein